MSKDLLPLSVGDISGFARSLRKQLAERETLPSHLEMLNLLAKAAGHRNFQQYRAQAGARAALDSACPVVACLPVEVDYSRIRRLVRYFDGQGRLIRWPKKFSQRILCLWVLWSRIPARTSWHERDMNDWLEAQHLFGDYALLRRELVDQGLVNRTADGRAYTRLEQAPTAEARALLEYLRG